MSAVQWESVGLFATPLIKCRYDNITDAIQAFNAVRQSSEQESNIQGDASANPLAHFGQFDDIARHPSMLTVKHQIETMATFAYRDLLNHHQSGDMQINGAWFNLAQKGAFQGKHSHANAMMCGTLYLNTDQHTQIDFYHPKTLSAYHPEIFDAAEEDTANAHGLRYHHRKVSVKVNTGDCLFWPAELQHGYENNRTENRLSLSFNLMPSRLNCRYQIN